MPEVASEKSESTPALVRIVAGPIMVELGAVTRLEFEIRVYGGELWLGIYRGRQSTRGLWYRTPIKLQFHLRTLRRVLGVLHALESYAKEKGLDVGE